MLEKWEKREEEYTRASKWDDGFKCVSGVLDQNDVWFFQKVARIVIKRALFSKSIVHEMNILIDDDARAAFTLIYLSTSLKSEKKKNILFNINDSSHSVALRGRPLEYDFDN